MKPNSIAGVAYRVADLARTAEFYDRLGFRRGKQEPDRVTFYVNWFSVTFIARDRADDVEPREPDAAPLGSGVFLYIKVDDIEAVHRELRANGLQPASEPAVRASGNREFLLRDPDGYRLVLFQKR